MLTNVHTHMNIHTGTHIITDPMVHTFHWFPGGKVVYIEIIQKTKIMASGPITSWQINGETMETMRDFIVWGSKITADCDRSHEIKSSLLLGRKAVTNLDRLFKKQRRSFANQGPSGLKLWFFQ